ncbi:MAG: AAA family ATPase [Candidatus Hydrogenedentes bacterium]|nr:AAA family ATPase [Candidatus Hydrogenedentota bacterium]
MNDTQSFLSFFGLREQPFAATADPAYFYATREHKECLFRLWNSIDERHGIAVVLGNYGTGKTTLLRKLITGMASDREKYNTAIIGSPIPSWTSFSLLEAIIAQFDLQPKTRSFVNYMESLNQYLLANRHRVTTLIIDDAQNLNKRGQLELLRLVQNLETPQHKLLNLALFAQMEWIAVLNAAPNFAQRVNLTYTLSALDVEETEAFIHFRLRQAGAADPGGFFTRDAVRLIQAYAEGSPRVTVTLCRNALLVAAYTGARPIGAEVILHPIEKTTLPDTEKRTRVVREVAALRMPSVTLPGASPPSEEKAPEFTAAPLLSAAAIPRTASAIEERASRLLLKAAKARQDINRGNL